MAVAAGRRRWLSEVPAAPWNGGISRADADQLRAEIGSTKRLVKLLMGQSGSTVRALAGLVDTLDGFEQRLNTTAQEAQDDHESQGV